MTWIRSTPVDEAGGALREADAIRWNSLLSESVFPPTWVPHTLHA